MTLDKYQTTLSPARQPFLFLTAALLAGILVDRWGEPPRAIAIATVVLSVATWVSLIVGKRLGAASLVLLISLSGAGAFLSHVDRTKKASSNLTRLFESHVINAADPVELTGVLAAPPEPAPGSYYLDVEAEFIRARETVMPVTGRARLMISLLEADARADFDALSLDYGVPMRVLVRLERGTGYANPGSPDFNCFLERHGYDLRGVIKSPLLIERLADPAHTSALAVLYNFRLGLMRSIEATFNPKVGGTLKAMLTGNRYFLDRETVETLRQGSTFHILVIAGLHIGIIAWALLGAWSNGRSGRRGRQTVRVISCLIVLWSYAVMVGLAPPVTRATAMITVGVIGPLLFRRAASINTVAMAAFFMLAFKPALVADPGFQLSMAAVGGIVALALPCVTKLQEIGQWRPRSRTPHPPSCPGAVRYLAETLFWNEHAFSDEIKSAPIRYRLRKANAARVLGRFRIQFLVRGAALLMITSAAIQLSTLPLMAMYFNRVAPIGVLLNVVAGLLTGVLMLSAIGAIVVGALNGVIANAFIHVSNAAHYLLVNAVAPFIELPFATFRVAHYEGWHTIIYALYFVPLGMLAVLLDQWHPVDVIRPVLTGTSRIPASIARRIRCSFGPTPFRRFAASVLTALAVTAAMLVVISPPVIQTNGKLTIYFLDVGQGDSALVVFPRGKSMLVDGGGEIRFDKASKSVSVEPHSDAEPMFMSNEFSIGEAVVSRFIWSLGRTRIDYLLASHAHADHMGGLSDLLRNIPVREAIIGYAPSNDPEYRRFSDAARLKKTPIFSVSAGEKFDIDGVTVEVLWPPPADGRPVTSGNDDSVVLRLVYGSISILLAGDIEEHAEESLVKSGIDLQADVLKVPHHGSKTSSTDEFVDAVNPKVAVISVGERSRFGHPHSSVVNRYLARGIELLQTGRNGMVTVASEGSTIDVKTYKKSAGGMTTSDH